MDTILEILTNIYVACPPVFWFAIPALVVYLVQVLLFRFFDGGFLERGSLFLFVFPLCYILYALLDPAKEFGSWKLIGVVFGLFIGMACYTGYWMACMTCEKTLI